MAFDINNIYVFRIIPIQNLEQILSVGLFCKNAGRSDVGFVSIGSEDVITRRDTAFVKCFPSTVVNDYIPFYFSVRTPMLFNIITGHGVPEFQQKNIIYLCFKLTELASDDFQWCYTNGNAAAAITRFYNDLTTLESDIDWRSIRTTDFRDENADGDEDRVRKKHAEFLVKDHIPSEFIKVIVVLNEEIKNQVEALLLSISLDIPVKINPSNKFYFV